jgi:hypothetical protein
MITAHNIISALQELDEEWAVARRYPRKNPINISENPYSLAEVMRDLKNDIRDPTTGFRQDPFIRFLYSPEKDFLLAWCAAAAIHKDFSKSKTDILGTIDVQRRIFFTQSLDPSYTPSLDTTYPSLKRFEKDLKRTENYIDVKIR